MRRNKKNGSQVWLPIDVNGYDPIIIDAHERRFAKGDADLLA